VLGDVSDGVTPCDGDNLVQVPDLSFLGSHYGVTLTGTEPWTCLDVGPTTDYSVTGRPTTDGKLGFEDLIMFAIDFTVGGGPIAGARPVNAERDELLVEAPAQVRAGESFRVSLRVRGAGGLRAISVPLTWDAAVVAPRGMSSTGFLERQQGIVLSPGPGTVDAAMLGARAQGIAGDGVLAEFTFVALRDGAPAIAIGETMARDLANRAVTLGEVVPAPQVPVTTRLERVMPNPFGEYADIEFGLSRSGRVEVAIYSVDGRLVRPLLQGEQPAGRHVVRWDRRDSRGDRVGAGLYIVRLTTAQGRTTRKLTVVN
jgi:hypothetical protein